MDTDRDRDRREREKESGDEWSLVNEPIIRIRMDRADRSARWSLSHQSSPFLSFPFFRSTIFPKRSVDLFEVVGDRWKRYTYRELGIKVDSDRSSASIEYRFVPRGSAFPIFLNILDPRYLSLFPFLIAPDLLRGRKQELYSTCNILNTLRRLKVSASLRSE